MAQPAGRPSAPLATPSASTARLSAASSPLPLPGPTACPHGAHRNLRLLQAWQPQEGGLLATGGEDGKVLIYNIRDVIEGLPQTCIPCACLELADGPVTQVIWGPDGQLYTGHSSGEPASERFCPGVQHYIALVRSL